MAEQIVRHFQAEGFTGISEALVVRIGLRHGDRPSIEGAFAAAVEQGRNPPVGEYFEVRPYGHYSDFRSFEAARSFAQADFGVGLRGALPAIYFSPAPVVVDDALATGTRYDALMKLQDNRDGYAFAILLNDPDSSFFEYLGTERGNSWQKIIEAFETTATSFAPDIDLS